MIDELVFKKAQKGDAESFYKLLSPIKEKLYRVAFIYFKNENDAMDALQDSIVKGIKYIDKCKNAKTFNAWMSIIVINTCKNNYKKAKKLTPIDINNFKNEFTYEDKDITDYTDLYDALDKISENEKDLIVKRYLEDMTIKDISRSKDLPQGTVKSGISRTLKKLKVILGEE